MSTIFLTGGTGFLGSHIAEALLAAGHTLTCSVRRTSDTRWLDPLDVETVVLDLSGPGTSEAALAGFNALVHCGGLTSARNEAEFMAVNGAGTERLARAATEAGVARFVLISSLAARGPDGAAGPISPYGRSKAAAEARLAVSRGDMSTVILRPGGVYGPRDSDLLPLFKLVARGWTVIPRSRVPLQPVYVADVVSAVLAALEAPSTDAPLEISGSGVHTWTEMARALAGAVGRSGRVVRLPPAVFWGAGLMAELVARIAGTPPVMDRRRARDLCVHAWTCENRTAIRALHPWEPAVDLGEGLARTASWYREAGWL